MIISNIKIRVMKIENKILINPIEEGKYNIKYTVPIPNIINDKKANILLSLTPLFFSFFIRYQFLNEIPPNNNNVKNGSIATKKVIAKTNVGDCCCIAPGISGITEEINQLKMRIKFLAENIYITGMMVRLIV